MRIKQFDFISPKITLYSEKALRHKNPISGVLTIIAYIAKLSFVIMFISELFSKKPITSFYNKYTDVFWDYSFNSKGMFHYTLTSTNPKQQRTTIIGSYQDTNAYIYDRNLSSQDHWVYDTCVMEDFGDLKKYQSEAYFSTYFPISLCIRYMWSSNDQKFYDNSSPQFKYPNIMQDKDDPHSKSYKIFFNKCRNETIYNDLFGACDSEEVIDESLINAGAFLYVVDSNVDVDDYNSPFKYSFTGLADNYQKNIIHCNYIYFSPLQVDSALGFLFTRTESLHGFCYDKSEKSSIDSNFGNGILSIMELKLEKKVLYYNRSYTRLPTVLSNIWASSELTNIVILIINYLFSKYIKFLDCEDIMYSFSNKIKEKKKEFIVLNNSINKNSSMVPATANNNPNNSNINFLKISKEAPSTLEAIRGGIKVYKSELNLISKENSLKNNYDLPLILRTVSIFDVNFNHLLSKGKTKINFCDYVSYFFKSFFITKRINCKNRYINTVENLRKTILSEEALYDLSFFLELYIKKKSEKKKIDLN